VRATARVIGGSVALICRASPAALALFVTLQVGAAVAVGASLVVVRQTTELLLGPRPDLVAIGWHLGMLAALFTVTSFAGVWQRGVSKLLGERVSWRAYERVLDVACAVELSAFDSAEFHRRLLRVQGTVNQPMELTVGLLMLTSSIANAVAIFIVLATISPWLVVVLLIAIGPVVLTGGSYSRGVFDAAVRLGENDMRRHYLRSLLTTRDTAKEVRAYDLGPYLRRANGALFEERMETLRAVTRRGTIRAVATSALTAVALTVSIGGLGLGVLTDQLSLAMATTGVVAILQVGQLANGLASVVGQTYQNALFLDDYNDFCATAWSAPAAATACPTGGFDELAVRAVTFTYPEATVPAVREVSLTIRRGELVALVGENGSGKTTLAKLLSRLYRPDSGDIRWDGIELGELDPAGVRAQIAVVFQDFARYRFTADDLAGITRAAVAAGADGFVGRLPRGYQTVLGVEHTDGLDLSGGQWQRIAVARAFFRDAPFVVLDEPTAALDAFAEADLSERIRALAAGRTVLVVSHRLASVRTADRIHVMADGRIVESGRHEELLALGGRYARMFRQQAATYQPS
jgi:ATP-binding cassette subfamily B protein